jgi:cobalt-zinc-cadmium efflux system outer membrane protein
MRMDQGFPQMGFDEGGGLARVRGVFHYVSAGAMVTVPITNRNQGEVARAQAERVSATARLEAVQLAAQTELAAAEAQDLQTRRALAWVEGGVRLARQNLDVVQQTYELGRTTVADVLAEQRRYLDIERAYTETLKAAYEARTALQRARGDR